MNWINTLRNAVTGQRADSSLVVPDFSFFPHQVLAPIIGTQRILGNNPLRVGIQITTIGVSILDFNPSNFTPGDVPFIRVQGDDERFMSFSDYGAILGRNWFVHFPGGSSGFNITEIIFRPKRCSTVTPSSRSDNGK